jgi:hypothetical protein
VNAGGDQGTSAPQKEAAGAGGWIAEALREHEEHERRERELSGAEQPGTGQPGAAQTGRPSGDHSHDRGRVERRTLPMADREQQVLDRIDRARRRRPKVRQGHPHPHRGGVP